MKLLTGNKIQSLDDSKSEPSLIPRLNSIVYLCAQTGSGKTNVLLNLLMNTSMWAQRFHQIFIICPTFELDPKWELLLDSPILMVNHKLINAIKKENNGKSSTKLFDSYDEQINYSKKIPSENIIKVVNTRLLTDLLEEQEHVIKKYGKGFNDKILIVYDDTIGKTKFWKDNKVKDLIFTCRHYDISVLVTSQDYYQLPKPIRNNVKNLILFFTGNQRDLQLIYQENSSRLSWKEFQKVFVEVTSKPYNFIFINKYNDFRHQIIDAFERFILPVD